MDYPKYPLVEASEISLADDNTRFVPTANPLDFSGAAHLSRYEFVSQNFDLTGRKVLDFGCGSGYGVQMLAPLCSQIIGVDLSEESVNFARRNTPKATFHALDVTNAEQVLRALGAHLDSFDYVISFDVIEHVIDYYSMVELARKLTASQGYFIVGCPNRLQTFHYNTYWEKYHIQEFTPISFQRLLGFYFNSVHLYGQDIKDGSLKLKVQSAHRRRTKPRYTSSIRSALFKYRHTVLYRFAREAYRRLGSWRGASEDVQPPDIGFFDGSERGIDQCFGLLAVCSKPKRQLRSVTD